MSDPIPFVQSRTDMKGNLKFRRLQRRFPDVPAPLLIGCIHSAWWHVADKGPDSGTWDTAKTPPEDVFEMDAEFSDRLIEEMVQARFLERVSETMVAIVNWQTVYGAVLNRRRSCDAQPRDQGGRFAPSSTVGEPYWDRNGTVDGPTTDGERTVDTANLNLNLNLNLKEKSRQEGHGRAESRAVRRERFVGELTTDPEKWKPLPKIPTECGYRVIDSPVPELDISHLHMQSMGIPDLDDRLAHRQYFVSEDKPNVLLVAWPDLRWVDWPERRADLKKRLEALGFDPWGGVCPRILTTTLPEAEKYLERFLEGAAARAGPEENTEI